MVKYLVMLCTVLALIQLSEMKPAYQVLKAKSGFIPVFIRYGDQPLSEIDPVLAEAFGEHEIKARNIKSDNNSITKLLPIENLEKSVDGALENIVKELQNSAGFSSKER